jgi:hypothetical protein
LLVYCDYLADLIKRALSADNFIVANVQGVINDVMDNRLVSMKKALVVTDNNGKRYKILVEEYDG